MKVGMTVSWGRISPVAESAGGLLVADIGDGSIQNLYYEHFGASPLSRKARRLADLEVTVFVCGSISESFVSLVEGYGIRVIPFICGQVKEILDTCLE